MSGGQIAQLESGNSRAWEVERRKPEAARRVVRVNMFASGGVVVVGR